MDYINLGGKERPILFNFRAISRFMRAEGLSMQDALNDIVGDLDLLRVTNLAYWGLRVGAEKSGTTEFDFSLETVEDWLDEDPKVMGDVMNLFAESSFWKRLEDDDSKQNGAAKKKKPSVSPA